MNDKVKVEFSEPYSEEEHVGYTTDFSEWVEFLKAKSEEDEFLPNFNLVTDGEFLEFFRDAAGFMLAPVAKCGSDILVAKSRKFSTIADLREHLDLEKVFVYQIIDTSGKQIKKEHEEKALEYMFAKKEIPEHMTENVESDYRIRYAELPS